jgi:pilus assembly protein CpaE
MTRQRRHLILNRSDDRVGLSARDVEATLGLTVDATVPTARSIPISINQGSPVVESDPRSPAARSLRQFAQTFTSTSPAPASGGWFSRKVGK